MALKRLNAEHLLAIQYLSLPKKGGKTDEEIAQICGVSRQSIANWKKDATFERELKRQIVRNTIDRLPDVFEKVPDLIIEQGNAALFKTLLQAHDMLTDKVEVNNVSNGEGTIDRDELKARLAKLQGE